MTDINIFERASRLKIRFATGKGVNALAVEDLWNLPLTSTVGADNLNDIAKQLSRLNREAEEESFVEKPTAKNEKIVVAFEIVKYIIKTRLAENEAAANAVADKQRDETILGIIEKKQNQELEGKSIEELQAMRKK